MKVGLCTPYKIPNYGTKLQAYAVQEKIRSMGFEVEVVDFIRRSDMRPNKLFHRYFNINFIKTKLANKKNKNVDDKKYQLGIKKRNDALQSFDRTHYRLSKTIKGYRGLKTLAQSYCAVVCGSDQIWLPTNVYNPTVTLEFAGEGCRRIAFAPSFGVSEIPKNKRREYVKFLESMDYISVREQSGQDLVRDLIGKEVPVILDPTLSIETDIWKQLADTGRKLVDGKYVFCYFLGDTEAHREAVKKYAKENNLKIVALPHFIEYTPCDNDYADVHLYDVTPCDFLNLIEDAECVFTDSFHASVFSILFKKKFYTFERFKASDRNSTNSRIYTLLKSLGLEDRLITNTNNFEDRTCEYQAVYNKLAVLRTETDRYLRKAFANLETESRTQLGFEIPEEKNCCGCGACEQICPRGCIKMVQSSESGFRYPVVLESSNCAHCGMCIKVCPTRQQINVLHSIGTAYYGKSLDDDLRKRSASGAVFGELAREFLKGGGYVCAASYSDKFVVQHTIISSETQLSEILGSKYSESDLGNCYSRIKELLENNQKVLFAGTPCQARGLVGFLRKKYENLTIVDLLCYGIQSPFAWQKYLKERAIQNIQSINMRSKHNSWENYSMRIEGDNGNLYLASKDDDDYLRSFAAGIFIRESCYACYLKAFPRASDITLGDFWDMDSICPDENDGLGHNIIIPQTLRGKELMNSLAYAGKIQTEVISSEALAEVHPLFCLPAKRSRKSKLFFKLISDDAVPFSLAIKKCSFNNFEVFARKKYRELKTRLR